MGKLILDLLEEHFDEAALVGLLGTERGAIPKALWERSLLGPVRTVLEHPGKGLRARLVDLGWRLGRPENGGELPAQLPLILELLHAGSLVVDDIQDQAFERRGAPALHHTVGLPLALNAGNWLYFWALLLLRRLAVSPATELDLERELTLAVVRCHHGQALDLACRVESLEPGQAQTLARSISGLKTGSLMGLATTLGALCAGAHPERVRALGEFGKELGIWLQMLNDLEGLSGDLGQGKVTWCWAWLEERLAPGPYRELVQRPSAERVRAALGGGGQAKAQQQLSWAFTRLVERCGPSTHLAPLQSALGELGGHHG